MSPAAPSLRSAARPRPSWIIAASVWALLGVCGTPVRAAGDPGPFFRIFLTDGSTLTSYGDFARVGDRVVFSLPIGELQGQPRLHLASVPSSRVDWDTTERYREATRASHYAQTRGEEDYARLSSAVARLLNDIALTQDPQKRLALAAEARGRLLSWPAEHYGYRLDEIRQILSLVDEVISEMRAAAGGSSFDLSLIAGVSGPPLVTPLPPPSLQESILQALWAAQLAPSAAERRILLEAAVGTLDLEAETLPAGWVTSTRHTAVERLAEETRLDARLAGLRTQTLGAAERLAARADVRGVERVVRVARQETAALTGREEEIKALLDTLEARLDATRRLRLARDQWAEKAGALRSYQQAVARPIRDLDRDRKALDDIRALAGPPVDMLSALDERLAANARQLARIAVPPDGQAAHAILTSAVQLATNAVRLRRTAIASGNMQQAWDASAAAAGALLLLDRARDDITRVLRPPELQ